MYAIFVDYWIVSLTVHSIAKVMPSDLVHNHIITPTEVKLCRIIIGDKALNYWLLKVAWASFQDFDITLKNSASIHCTANVCAPTSVGQ